MSAFEFLFSFYGLLLGLAVTVVLSGFSRAINERKRRPIGVLAPLLAIYLTLDLMTFWAGAWIDFRDVEFSARLLLLASLAPMLYYLAATQVFPEAGADVATLDEHFFKHRAWVIGGVALSNFVSFLPIISEPDVPARLLTTMATLAPLLISLFIKNRWVVGVLLAAQLAYVLVILLVLLDML
jgi:hypothetical protein